MSEKFDSLFVVMEYVEDSMKCLLDSATKKIETGVMSEQMITYLIYNALCCLTYFNKVGIAHRDMKPANMLVVEDVEVKIIDFGLARIIQPNKVHSEVRQALYDKAGSVTLQSYG